MRGVLDLGIRSSQVKSEQWIIRRFPPLTHIRHRRGLPLPHSRNTSKHSPLLSIRLYYNPPSHHLFKTSFGRLSQRSQGNFFFFFSHSLSKNNQFSSAVSQIKASLVPPWGGRGLVGGVLPGRTVKGAPSLKGVRREVDGWGALPPIIATHPFRHGRLSAWKMRRPNILLIAALASGRWGGLNWFISEPTTPTIIPWPPTLLTHTPRRPPSSLCQIHFAW